MTNWFKGKKVLVTGGSSGIGKAAAMLLADSGADVAIVARGADRLKSAAEALNGRPGRVVAFPLDISDRQSIFETTPRIVDTLGGLDVLINNAGVAHPGYFQDIPDDVFDNMMAVNYFGTVNMTRALLPHFMSQRHGHICNVSSILGFMGIFGYTAYAASKFAVVGFSDCLRQELLPYQVGVSILFPPDTDTPQLQAENEIKPAETKAVAGNVKVMQPVDVARAMLHGIVSGRYHIVPGFGSKFTYFMHRHCPWLVRLVTDGDVKRSRRR